MGGERALGVCAYAGACLCAMPMSTILQQFIIRCNFIVLSSDLSARARMVLGWISACERAERATTRLLIPSNILSIYNVRLYL